MSDAIVERKITCDEALLKEAFDLYYKKALIHTKGCRTKTCRQHTEKCCLAQRKIKGFFWLSKFLSDRQKTRLRKAVINYNKTKKRTRFDKVMRNIHKRLRIVDD